MGFDFTYHPRLVYYTVKGFIEERQLRHQLRKRYRDKFRELKKKNPRTVYLMMTPEHENVGDHAIALAETEFLRSRGIDYVEITSNEVEELQKHKLLSLANGSPILLQGGGYLGTFWRINEELLRALLAANRRSGIVLLPNTIYYDNTPEGQAYFAESQKLYAAHPNFHLYAREETSYGLMSDAYRNVKLMPDMVLSLKPAEECGPRKGCILSLRQDCEKTRTPEQESEIRQQARALFGDEVRDSDMVDANWIPVARREEAVRAKLAEFGSSELVITDRLHGMIFCALTGTPCIVLDSKSPKVRGCHAWVRDLENIRFVDRPEEIAQAFRQIPQQTFSYDNSFMEPWLEKLNQDLESIFHWG